MPAKRRARAVVSRLTPSIRRASCADLGAIRVIYNQGIEDRVATLDVEPKTDADIERWFADHDGRYAVLVAASAGEVIGWASLNRHSRRAAHAGVADLSIYVARAARGRGVGGALMDALVEAAREGGFHKIVLFALASNEQGRRLYRRSGFADVGVFREHGTIDGRMVDVLAMEKVFD